MLPRSWSAADFLAFSAAGAGGSGTASPKWRRAASRSLAFLPVQGLGGTSSGQAEGPAGALRSPPLSPLKRSAARPTAGFSLLGAAGGELSQARDGGSAGTRPLTLQGNAAAGSSGTTAAAALVTLVPLVRQPLTPHDGGVSPPPLAPAAPRLTFVGSRAAMRLAASAEGCTGVVVVPGVSGASEPPAVHDFVATPATVVPPPLRRGGFPLGGPAASEDDEYLDEDLAEFDFGTKCPPARLGKLLETCRMRLPRTTTGEDASPFEAIFAEVIARSRSALQDDVALDGECNAPAGHIDAAWGRKHELPLLALATKRLTWSMRRGEDKTTVVWVSTREGLIQCLPRLRDIDALSHIPGLGAMCGKDVLATALEAHGATSFCPRTWCLQEHDLAAIWEQAGGAAGAQPVALVAKPAGGTHGNGIGLARRLEDLQNAVARLGEQSVIVQEYIDRPLLLDGRKWDARLYVLLLPVPSIDGGFSLVPLLAREGLARVCVEPYEPLGPRNLHKLTMHLTNYSISKLSERYVHNEDPLDASQGCKRVLSAVLKRLEASQGLAAESLWAGLADLVRETAAAMTQPTQAAAFSASSWHDAPEGFAEMARRRFGQCFHLVGLDVLLDREGQPWLLEANSNPSLSLEELRPLEGVSSRSEMNKLFAEVQRGRCGRAPRGPRWGRPCRCAKLPRPHGHYQCPIDVAVKVPVIQGALTIARRVAERRASCGEAWDMEALVSGTIFHVV